MAEVQDDDAREELVAYLEDPPTPEEQLLLKRRFFPSKLGGRPAWLVPTQLPSEQQLRCKRCKSRLRFLLQVYASQGSIREGAFHRVIFVFVCTNCQPNEMRAFRAQLPRVTSYYSPERPDPESAKAEEPDPEIEALCCRSCFLPTAGAPALCEECTRRGKHGDAPAMFAERELTVANVEGEEDEDEEDEEEQAGEEALTADGDDLVASSSWGAGDELASDRMKQYREKVAADPEASLDRSEQKFYQQWEKERTVKDDVFARFERFSAENHSHVLRYELGGSPLWFCAPKRLEDEPPPCERCGGARTFEFQVQPQLIALLSRTPLADRLDYGTACIYVCKASCDPAERGSPYEEEFVYVQPEPVEEWMVEAT